MPALRIGFIGCGEVSMEKHMPAVAELKGEIDIVAAADRNAERLRHVVRRFGVRSTYPDGAGLLAHDGLDAVVACLPPTHQVATSLAALAAGKHLWVEAPLGLSLPECTELLKQAAQTNRVAMVGFHMRWHRQIRQARDMIRAGRLGRIQTLRAVWNSPRDENTEPEWRRHRALGGGALIEVASDHFDIWRYLLDSDVSEVFASSVDGHREDEAAVVSGRMTNGVLFSAVFSERATHDLEIEIGGTEGLLHIECIRFEGLRFHKKDEMPSALGPRIAALSHFARELPRAIGRMHRAGDYRLSYVDQWRHFLDCVHRGAPVEAPLSHGRSALAVVLAALESRRTGMAVPVSTILS